MGFSILSGRFVKEWLYSHPGQKRRVLYRRRSDADSAEDEYRFGPSWKGPGVSLGAKTRSNALFLSTAASLNHDLALELVKWLHNSIRPVSWWPTEGEEHVFTMNYVNNRRVKRKVLEFIEAADIGISDFKVSETPLGPEERKRLERLSKARGIKVALEPIATLEINTIHRSGDYEAKFDLDEESDGTQKLFSLAGPWIYALTYGATLYIDELDARLHPSLTRMLVSLFHDEQTNRKNAQIIFTTHDSSLLSSEHFRKDQVWLTQKKRDGSTDLYSLSDIRGIRSRDDFGKSYLQGRYGAIPFLGTFDFENEQEGEEIERR